MKLVLIKTFPEKIVSIIRELHDINEIDNVFQLFGEYDMIAMIKSENMDEVENRIGSIDGILETKMLDAIK